MLRRERPVAYSSQEVAGVRAAVGSLGVVARGVVGVFLVGVVCPRRVPRDAAPPRLPVAPLPGHGEEQRLDDVTLRRRGGIEPRRDALTEEFLDVRRELRGGGQSGVIHPGCAHQDDARHQRLVSDERPARGHADAVGTRPRDELVDAVELEPARELGLELDPGGCAVAVDLRQRGGLSRRDLVLHWLVLVDLDGRAAVRFIVIVVVRFAIVVHVGGAVVELFRTLHHRLRRARLGVQLLLSIGLQLAVDARTVRPAFFAADRVDRRSVFDLAVLILREGPPVLVVAHPSPGALGNGRARLRTTKCCDKPIIDHD